MLEKYSNNDKILETIGYSWIELHTELSMFNLWNEDAHAGNIGYTDVKQFSENFSVLGKESYSDNTIRLSIIDADFIYYKKYFWEDIGKYC